MHSLREGVGKYLVIGNCVVYLMFLLIDHFITKHILLGSQIFASLEPRTIII